MTSIELENFRIPGQRRWKFEPTQSLHLVHGHNGSGKSSFCEALEMVVTGKVERLTGADYAKVLTNRSAQQESKTAVVTLRSRENKGREWAVVPEGVKEPLRRDLPAASFRMDQGLADRISQSKDPAERARRFLDAFFPEEREELTKRNSAEAIVTAVIGKLPERLRYLDTSGRPDLNKIKESLGWVANSSFPWEKVISLLPV